MLNEIDCFLVLGNDNLYISRKDCNQMQTLIESNHLENVVMLMNSSPNAGEEQWPKQFEKEQDNKDKYMGAAAELCALLQ
jgi:hypothetical protein